MGSLWHLKNKTIVNITSKSTEIGPVSQESHSVASKGVQLWGTQLRATKSHYCPSLSAPLLLRANVRQKHVDHVLDDDFGWMESVRKVVRHAHLPGVHQQHVHSLEHGPEHLVQLQGVPVAVEQAHLLVQGLEVPRANHDDGPRRSVQQPHQRAPDVTQPPDVHLHRKSAEVRPDAEDHHGVGAPGEAVQLVGDVAQLAGQDGGEADGRAVAAVLQQNVMGAVHRHERPDVFRAVQVELL